ncbi:hypothetical protein B0J14DRAFT_324220 [Halenospora varia]|nr:hypothetical protein B0J14DRAFT_324220 [Halenospora varia]
MKTSSILLPLGALFSTSAALAIKSRATDPYYWSVTNYTEGCSPAGCAYKFSLSPTSTPEFEPKVATTCVGNDINGYYEACSDPAFSTYAVPGAQNQTLLVKHEFYQGEARYTIIGNHTITYPNGKPDSTEFAVPQSTIYAVA